MIAFNSHSKLSDILLNHPSLIPVINRCGINLGVGDKSIFDVCNEKRIDPLFLVTLINTFVNPDYFPSASERSFPMSETIDYLEKTSDYYLGIQIPNIERHFEMLIKISGKDNNLGHLLMFFQDMKKQFEDAINFEKQHLYPILKNGGLPGNITPSVLENNREVEEKIHDLLTFFVVHLKGSFDRNLSMGVISAVFSLYQDVRQNNRIKFKILLPSME